MCYSEPGVTGAVAIRPPDTITNGAATKMTKRAFMLIELLVASAILALVPFSLRAQDVFTDESAIATFLHEKFDGKNCGMVIGLVDEHGSRIFSAGGLGDGTGRAVNGGTVFEIGSITKTFTALLLQDMVERGEMNLDDPVAKYLPATARVPSRNGKQITLLQLATHTSGLPRDVQNAASPNKNNPFDFSSDQLYAFLSDYSLPRDPGAMFEYSNLGVGLLGHAIALKAGSDYESLVVDRICNPLHMNDTRAVLRPELKARLAAGHDASGNRVANYDFRFQTMIGCGGLRSTVNDLLKYVSAQCGLTSSSLSPLMEKTHVIRYTNAPGLEKGVTMGNVAMPWLDSGMAEQTGMNALGHAGGTAGYSAFIGFDLQRHRGVAVLFNEYDGGNGVHAQQLAWLLLQGVPLTPQMLENLFPANNGKLVGIGVTLGFDRPPHTVWIDAVIPNTPAAQAGLTPGLIIQKINDFQTANRSLDLCLCLIRGHAGTKVRLEVMDPKRNETKTVELIRQNYTNPKA